MYMILRKSLNIAACVRVCVYVHVVLCVVCMCMCGRGSSTSLIALYVKLNEAVALVRTT